MHQPLIDDRHRVTRFFDEQDRSRGVHLEVGPDRLLNERESVDRRAVERTQVTRFDEREV